MAQKFEAI
jgi:hypothetical protein